MQKEYTAQKEYRRNSQVYNIKIVLENKACNPRHHGNFSKSYDIEKENN